MAKAKTLTTNKLKNPKVLVLLVFLFGFSGWGVWKLAFSSAATSEGLYYNNYFSVSKQSVNVKNVEDPAAPYPVSAYGTAPTPHYVSQLTAGGTLIYDPPRPTFPIVKRTCYVMRVPAQYMTAKVEIVSWDAAKVVTVTDRYQEHCVSASAPSDGNGRYYNVKFVSGSPVNVLHMAQYITPSSDPTNPENFQYPTKVSDNIYGAVFACKIGPNIYLKAVSKTGTVLSYWFDNQAPTDKTIPSSKTTYHYNIWDTDKTTNFNAYIHAPRTSTGGPADPPPAPATMDVNTIGSCN